MKLLAHREMGAMPAFGARIMETVLEDAELRRVWEGDVKRIAAQLRERRMWLRRMLEDLGTPGNWKHVTDQVGMFSWVHLVLCVMTACRADLGLLSATRASQQTN